ncbi:MAG: hypothetical protein ABW133_12010 [Polyangiaceae bacterium]
MRRDDAQVTSEGLKRTTRAWELRRMGRKIAIVAACVLLATFGPIAVVRADPPPILRIVGPDAACPTAKQVASLLERMLPRTKIRTDAASGAAEAEVSDQGAQFRVVMGTQERSFDDGQRQCAERARHAAVFIAMVLDPPLIADAARESPAPPPAKTVDPPRPSVQPREAKWQWDATLGAVMLVTPEAEGRDTAFAQGVAAFVRGKRGWHLALGAGLLRGSLSFDSASASAWWVPIDFAGGFSTRAQAWELGGEVGPNVALLSIMGADLKDAERQFRLELGGRAAAWSRFWLSRQFAAFLSVEAVVRPFPHVLDIDPRGRVGDMPAIWVGGSAGIAAAID